MSQMDLQRDELPKSLNICVLAADIVSLELETQNFRLFVVYIRMTEWETYLYTIYIYCVPNSVTRCSKLARPDILQCYRRSVLLYLT